MPIYLQISFNALVVYHGLACARSLAMTMIMKTIFGMRNRMNEKNQATSSITSLLSVCVCMCARMQISTILSDMWKKINNKRMKRAHESYKCADGG